MKIFEVESSYRGYQYIIRRFTNDRGVLVRCGYVKLKKINIDLLKINSNDTKKVSRKVSMPGGCTFVGKFPWARGLWIGFTTLSPFEFDLTEKQRIKYIKAIREEIKTIIDQVIFLTEIKKPLSHGND